MSDQVKFHSFQKTMHAPKMNLSFIWNSFTLNFTTFKETKDAIASENDFKLGQ